MTAITWDRRTPRSLEQYNPDWNDLANQFSLQAHWNQDPFGSGTFLHSRINLLTLNGEARLNRGLSAGWRFHRSGGDFRIMLNYEYLHDSGIPAIPEDTHLISLSIRANTPFVIQ